MEEKNGNKKVGNDEKDDKVNHSRSGDDDDDGDDDADDYDEKEKKETEDNKEKKQAIKTREKKKGEDMAKTREKEKKKESKDEEDDEIDDDCYDDDDDDNDDDDDDDDDERDDDDDMPGKYVIVQLDTEEKWDWAPARIVSRNQKNLTYRVRYYQNNSDNPEGPWLAWKHDAKPSLVYRQMITCFDIKLVNDKIPLRHIESIATEKFDGQSYVTTLQETRQASKKRNKR